VIRCCWLEYFQLSFASHWCSSKFMVYCTCA